MKPSIDLHFVHLHQNHSSWETAICHIAWYYTLYVICVIYFDKSIASCLVYLCNQHVEIEDINVHYPFVNAKGSKILWILYCYIENNSII